MTEEEIRIRSIYLFLACSQVVDEAKQQLVASLPQPPLSSRLLLERAITRELGLLFRYWATRIIWEKLSASENDAKQLNLALLRLFTSGMKIPRDGSGLKYAEMSSVADEVRELGLRLTNALGSQQPPLLAVLQGGVMAWRASIVQRTADAINRPPDQLTAEIKDAF